jgi:hypothetical protein
MSIIHPPTLSSHTRMRPHRTQPFSRRTSCAEFTGTPAEMAATRAELAPQLPLLVMGFPKSGTSSLHSFFQCIGLRSSQWWCKDGVQSDEVICGKMIERNVVAGRPALANLSEWDAFAEMDAYFETRSTCYFPQRQALNELHAAAPTATFILNMRNLTNWLTSVDRWHRHNLRNRMIACDQPGFPAGVGKLDSEMFEFYRSQAQLVRDFAATHPSHKLVEVQIDDPEQARAALGAAFGHGRAKKCWGEAKNVGDYHQH